MREVLGVQRQKETNLEEWSRGSVVVKCFWQFVLCHLHHHVAHYQPSGWRAGVSRGEDNRSNHVWEAAETVTNLFQDTDKTWYQILIWFWIPLDDLLQCTERSAHHRWVLW